MIRTGRPQSAGSLAQRWEVRISVYLTPFRSAIVLRSRPADMVRDGHGIPLEKGVSGEFE